MPQPNTARGETAVTVTETLQNGASNELKFILCAQNQYLANAQRAAGLQGINTLFQRIQPTEATNGDYDTDVIFKVFEAMVVDGDFDRLQQSTDLLLSVQMSAALMEAISAVLPEPKKDDNQGNSESGG